MTTPLKTSEIISSSYFDDEVNIDIGTSETNRIDIPHDDPSLSSTKGQSHHITYKSQAADFFPQPATAYIHAQLLFSKDGADLAATDRISTVGNFWFQYSVLTLTGNAKRKIEKVDWPGWTFHYKKLFFGSPAYNIHRIANFSPDEKVPSYTRYASGSCTTANPSVVTITTAQPHNFSVGYTVELANFLDSGATPVPDPNGNQVVVSVTSETVFTFSLVNATAASWGPIIGHVTKYTTYEPEPNMGNKGFKNRGDLIKANALSLTNGSEWLIEPPFDFFRCQKIRRWDLLEMDFKIGDPNDFFWNSSDAPVTNPSFNVQDMILYMDTFKPNPDLGLQDQLYKMDFQHTYKTWQGFMQPHGSGVDYYEHKTTISWKPKYIFALILKESLFNNANATPTNQTPYVLQQGGGGNVHVAEYWVTINGAAYPTNHVLMDFVNETLLYESYKTFMDAIGQNTLNMRNRGNWDFEIWKRNFVACVQIEGDVAQPGAFRFKERGYQHNVIWHWKFTGATGENFRTFMLIDKEISTGFQRDPAGNQATVDLRPSTVTSIGAPQSTY